MVFSRSHDHLDAVRRKELENGLLDNVHLASLELASVIGQKAKTYDNKKVCACKRKH